MIPYFGFPLASSNLSAKLIQKPKPRLYYFMLFVMIMALICNEEMSESIYQGTANEAFVIHQCH